MPGDASVEPAYLVPLWVPYEWSQPSCNETCVRVCSLWKWDGLPDRLQELRCPTWCSIGCRVWPLTVGRQVDIDASHPGPWPAPSSFYLPLYAATVHQANIDPDLSKSASAFMPQSLDCQQAIMHTPWSTPTSQLPCSDPLTPTPRYPMPRVCQAHNHNPLSP